jgi:hypothetical protein
MSASYKIREVRVSIRPGVTIIAEVTSVEDIGAILKDLQGKGFEPSNLEPDTTEKPEIKKKKLGAESESPAGMMETRASLAAGSLASAKVLAFKDGVPQLLRPGSFPSVSDATLALIYALEVGIKNTNITYEDFKAVFEAQNIKSGTPLPMLLSNLKDSGYVDKAAYSSNRSVRLTAKGEKRAEEVLKLACSVKPGSSAS